MSFSCQIFSYFEIRSGFLFAPRTFIEHVVEQASTIAFYLKRKMPGIRLSAAAGAKIIESITRRYQVPAVPSRRKKEEEEKKEEEKKEEEKKEEEKKERRKERRRKEIIFFAAFFSYLDQLVL